MLERLRDLLSTKHPKSNSPKEIGDFGESLAAKYLKRTLGYKIISKNWRNPKNLNQEIDIVAKDGEVLVFVEVKTQQGEQLIRAYYRAVGKNKKENMAKACRAYLLQKSVNSKHFRYDVVEVKLCQNGENIIQCFKNVNLIPNKHFHA